MLSETRFANEGQLKKGKAGYPFFWSGRNSEDRREAGVGFAKTNLISTLTMTFRLPFRGKHYAAVISGYAPTMTNPEEIKDKFYKGLENILVLEGAPGSKVN